MNLLLDTNLLVVVVVGLTDVRLVGTHKRTKAYTRQDYEILAGLVEAAETLVTTPHVLAEVSNLLGDDDPRGCALQRTLRDLVFGNEERYEHASVVCRHDAFERLGMADCGVLSVLDNRTHLVTADLGLYLRAAAEFPHVTNYTHVRQAGGVFA